MQQNQSHVPHLSFWEKDHYLSGIDFLIVGAGIVGLNAALRWRRHYPEAKIVVLERGVFPTGASTKNAGFACFGSLSELYADYQQSGAMAMVELVAKRWRGLQHLRELCGDKALVFKQLGGFELFLERDEKEMDGLAFLPELNELLQPILNEKHCFQLVEKTAAFSFGGLRTMVHNRLEGQLHPGRMMQRLRELATQQHIQIWNGVTVRQLEPGASEVLLETTDGWTIRSARVLVCTNGLTTALLPGLAVRPARNQVLITQPIPGLSFAGTFHYDQGYYYFRNVGQRVLLGGARNLDPIGETTDQLGLTEAIQAELERFLRTVVLPNHHYTIDHRWSGILGVGPRKAPIVQKVHPRLGVAVRLGGMGVAIGAMVGQEGAELMV